MKFKWPLVLVFTMSVQVFADTPILFPVLECPAIGNEYEQMIAKLDTIKTSIKKDANCQNVGAKVQDLEQEIEKNRQQVIDIINNAQNQPLDAAKSKIIHDYAENITKQVSILNDLFIHSNYCFRGDQPEQGLAALASFVGEASQWAGSLSGPWGTPIALAGNVVAGFLTGLDQILKSRAGYDFTKREQWTSYVQNLCTYHSYRDQIDHLLNPQARLNQLHKLMDQLNGQINTMANSCAECRSILNSYDPNTITNPSASLSFFAKEIQAANQKFGKPYGTFMVQNLGIRQWVQAEITRVQQESQSYWADASGRHVLSQAKSDIESFLIEREAPKFLDSGVYQSQVDYQTFLEGALREGRPLFGSLYQADGSLFAGRLDGVYWGDALSVFRLLVVQPIDWNQMPVSAQTEDLQYQWTHYKDQGLDNFRTAQASTQVVQTFCSFFKHAGFYSPDIRRSCSQAGFQKMAAEQAAFSKELNGAGLYDSDNLHTYISIDDPNVAATPLDALTKEIELRGAEL